MIVQCHALIEVMKGLTPPKAPEGAPTVRLRASGTARDKHGDRVTDALLESMAEQARQGVVKLKENHLSTFPLGYSFGAEIVEAEGGEKELLIDFWLYPGTQAAHYLSQIEGGFGAQCSVGLDGGDTPIRETGFDGDGQLTGFLQRARFDHVAFTPPGEAAYPAAAVEGIKIAKSVQEFVMSITKTTDELDKGGPGSGPRPGGGKGDGGQVSPSRRARDLSIRANSSGKKADHEHAARAHADAAESTRSPESGRPTIDSRAHEKLSEIHSRRAASAEKSDSATMTAVKEPDMDTAPEKAAPPMAPAPTLKQEGGDLAMACKAAMEHMSAVKAMHDAYKDGGDASPEDTKALLEHVMQEHAMIAQVLAAAMQGAESAPGAPPAVDAAAAPVPPVAPAPAPAAAPVEDKTGIPAGDRLPDAAPTALPPVKPEADKQDAEMARKALEDSPVMKALKAQIAEADEKNQLLNKSLGDLQARLKKVEGLPDLRRAPARFMTAEPEPGVASETTINKSSLPQAEGLGNALEALGAQVFGRRN